MIHSINYKGADCNALCWAGVFFFPGLGFLILEPETDGHFPAFGSLILEPETDGHFLECQNVNFGAEKDNDEFGFQDPKSSY